MRGLRHSARHEVRRRTAASLLPDEHPLALERKPVGPHAPGRHAAQDEFARVITVGNLRAGCAHRVFQRRLAPGVAHLELKDDTVVADGIGRLKQHVVTPKTALPI